MKKNEKNFSQKHCQVYTTSKLYIKRNAFQSNHREEKRQGGEQSRGEERESLFE
jgi:hypothetical protein